MNELQLISQPALAIARAATMIALQYDAIEPMRRASLVNIANDALLLAAAIDGVSMDVFLARLTEYRKLNPAE